MQVTIYPLQCCVLQKLWHTWTQTDREPTTDPSFLLAFPLLLALSTPCHTCKCKLQHPQTVYCASDFPFVLPSQTLKLPDKAPAINVIYSPLSPEDCGYQLKTPQQSQLLIAGILRKGLVRFTRCHLVYFWYRLTKEQKLGFQSEYSKGCGCQIQPCTICSRTCHQPDVKECLRKQRDCNYDIWEGDQYTLSTCLPSKAGSCEWVRVQNTSQSQI
ncbi:metalloproteinase inhibitor 1-like [Trichechus inunguis]